ncbi:HlyD family secretion protein [Stenotrophomonas sp. TWI1183]|uniref:HlyD family secretion protein n=1 Tax=Stenotrophomonas sp. TWI1183 TaxID=3136799 RepID=UPI0032093647
MTNTTPSRSAHADASGSLIRKTRRPAVIGAIALCLLAAGGAGIRWWTAGRFMVSTDNAYVRADIATISPRVTGYIVNVGVRDNQRVAKGDVLATLDDRDYRMRVARAEGAVAAAKAALDAQYAAIANLDAQGERQRSVIAATTADVQARQADHRQATLEYRRERALEHQQASDARHLEAADASATRTEAAVQAARATAEASRAYAKVLATERQRSAAALDEARGALLQAEAGLALANLDLEHTVIRAPMGGTIGQRAARVGAYVGPGSPLMAIVPNEVYVIANYKEVQLEGVAPGQRVEVEVDALGGGVLKGRVESFAPASGAQFALLPPDNATGNFTKIVQRIPVRIAVDAAQPKLSNLRPGMSVVASINTRPESSP